MVAYVIDFRKISRVNYDYAVFIKYAVIIPPSSNPLEIRVLFQQYRGKMNKNVE